MKETEAGIVAGIPKDLTNHAVAFVDGGAIATVMGKERWLRA